MTANREYKDNLFSWLFGAPDTLRELYGALNGFTLPPDIPISLNTLEGILFKTRVNDISFSIGGRLVILIEHQSTINENMPLRLLLYISRVYENMTRPNDIYRSRPIPLFFPEFIVLYNGKAPYPDEKSLNLSSAFYNPADLGLPPTAPSLELTVRVYNINAGHNVPILQRCRTLGEYSAFIARVRFYERAGETRDEAMKRAVKDCIEENILKDFLEIHGTEVISMLMTEWKLEDALAIKLEEGREEGWEKGWEKGRKEGREEGIEKGRREIARSALAEGLSIQTIQRITGLDGETIERLSLQ